MKLIYWLGLAWILVVTSMWVGLGYVAFMGIKAVSNDGVKGVIERVWCGAQGCR